MSPFPNSGSLGPWFATSMRYYEDTPTPVVPSRPPPVVPCRPIPCGASVLLRDGRSQRHITGHHWENWSPGSPSLPDRESSTRSRQTSQVPESTLCTHAPLFDPGWLNNTTATQCRRVLPSACLERVGFPQLYNFSGFYHAACVLATTVLHAYPCGSRAEFATDLLAGFGRVGLAPTG